MLILISGPSGVGKNTVIDLLRQRNKSLKFMKTCTTRKSRAQNDGAYYHVSPQKFTQMIKNGELFEYENVHADLFYGTPYKSLAQVIEGKNDFVKDIDVKGVQKIKQYLAGKIKVVTVFLDAEDDELEKRLRGRGENEQMIQKRLGRVELERGHKQKYDLSIVNKNVLDTTIQIEEFAGLGSARQ